MAVRSRNPPTPTNSRHCDRPRSTKARQHESLTSGQPVHPFEAKPYPLRVMSRPSIATIALPSRRLTFRHMPAANAARAPIQIHLRGTPRGNWTPPPPPPAGGPPNPPPPPRAAQGGPRGKEVRTGAVCTQGTTGDRPSFAFLGTIGRNARADRCVAHAGQQSIAGDA